MGGGVLGDGLDRRPEGVGVGGGGGAAAGEVVQRGERLLDLGGVLVAAGGGGGQVERGAGEQATGQRRQSLSGQDAGGAVAEQAIQLQEQELRTLRQL